ncbi:GPI transamidase subunit PIG-U-domain-containing protein [Lactarius pseudohatsudake]|nr:GPI transamidase subunit PIG-U-domain-containing protein [Lactarius pseudohatsudake]
MVGITHGRGGKPKPLVAGVVGGGAGNLAIIAPLACSTEEKMASTTAPKKVPVVDRQLHLCKEVCGRGVVGQKWQWNQKKKKQVTFTVDSECGKALYQLHSSAVRVHWHDSDPLYASFLLLGILGTFKPYPTLSDPGLFLSFIYLFPKMCPYICYLVVMVLLHLHTFLLLPLFHHLWIGIGTGNANFFYAIRLVAEIGAEGQKQDYAVMAWTKCAFHVEVILVRFGGPEPYLNHTGLRQP